jgi:nucleotide-binding universal stress UspA family protein
MNIPSIPTGSRIVVGVDNTPASSAAVAWAVDECAVRGTSLLIAHCPAPADPRQVWVGGEIALRVMDQHADTLLTAYAAATCRRQRSVVVSTHLSHSDPANALIDLSAGSQLIVVGAPYGRSAAFGVGRRVVAHSHCPVVVVPQPQHLPATARPNRVVEILSGEQHDADARRLAAHEAALRGVRLDTVSLADAAENLRSTPAALAVVGRGCGDDHWSSRLDGPLDELLAALPCPFMIVGEPAAVLPLAREPRSATAGLRPGAGKGCASS